ncbi:hypothetical protein Tco_1569647 [Tanacetum coccineum]
MQSKKKKRGKVDSEKILDADLVVTESSRTESEKHVSSSRSGNDTLTKDADINPVNDKQPMAEVQLFVKHNMLANEQQHYVQSESIYDTYLLEKCVNMELKYQNQVSKNGQHGQILNETSNKAKIKKEIEVLETINIELEHSVTKLLAENEKLHKENKHLKQTYNDLYDSIQKTRVQTKDHNESLIAQINSKTIENADLKA